MFKKFVSTVFLYFTVFVLTSVAFNHFVQNGFGRGDLVPLFIWGFPSILLNSFLLTLINRYLEEKALALKLPIKFFLFFTLPFLGSYSYTLFLGPWFGALSITPLPPHYAAVFVILVLKSRDVNFHIAKNLFSVLIAVLFFGVLLNPITKKLRLWFLDSGTVPLIIKKKDI